MDEKKLIYETKDKFEIYTIPGRKSPYDFRVRYKAPDKRMRQPKHIHFAVDLLIKYSYNKDLTLELRDALLQIFLKARPSNSYPPKLQFFKESNIKHFSELEGFGEYSIEFILVASELIMIQEITNRAATLGREPSEEERRKMQAYKMYNSVDKDIYSVSSAATWKGPGAIT